MNTLRALTDEEVVAAMAKGAADAKAAAPAPAPDPAKEKQPKMSMQERQKVGYKAVAKMPPNKNIIKAELKSDFKSKKEKKVKRINIKKVTKIAKPKNVKKPTKKRAKGPAAKLFKFKDERIKGQCDIEGCKAKAAPNAYRCKKHKKEVRRAQLKLNNVVWRKRVKEGTAGHRVLYTYKKKTAPTAWAVERPDEALRAASKSERFDIQKVKKLLSQAKKAKKS